MENPDVKDVYIHVLLEYIMGPFLQKVTLFDSISLSNFDFEIYSVNIIKYYVRRESKQEEMALSVSLDMETLQTNEWVKKSTSGKAYIFTHFLVQRRYKYFYKFLLLDY